MEKPQARITEQEREEISRGLVPGESSVAIGIRLGRDSSAICHEIKRHGGGVSAIVRSRPRVWSASEVNILSDTGPNDIAFTASTDG